MLIRLRFWSCVILLISGAAALGYGSGSYHSTREAKLSTHTVLQEFVHSTDMADYLQQRGQPEWLTRLNTYGLAGSDSYLRIGQQWASMMLVGLLAVAVGLVGLCFAARSLNGTNRIPS